MNSLDMPELLTIREAAKLINVHPNTLRNWEREGKVSAIRLGSRRDRRYCIRNSLSSVLHHASNSRRSLRGFSLRKWEDTFRGTRRSW